jgi:hypothetical protein
MFVMRTKYAAISPGGVSKLPMLIQRIWTFASQVRSCTCSSNSEAAKYFTLDGGGLPKGFNNRAAARIYDKTASSDEGMA